jgi:hypothetical protein
LGGADERLLERLDPDLPGDGLVLGLFRGGGDLILGGDLDLGRNPPLPPNNNSPMSKSVLFRTPLESQEKFS